MLVAVDGSENSDRALDFALEFADKYDAELTVINVTESSGVAAVPPELAAYTSDNMVAVAKDLRKFHEDILTKAMAHVKATKPNLPVSAALRDGNPASEIVAAAKEGSFDVVVLGHRGVSKVREIFLGSISDKVVHSLPCTVIIVK